MIYTVTLNPAIDFIVRLPELEIGGVNRMQSDDLFAGGKGINISRVLARLGISNVAWGFTAGFTGDFIKSALAAASAEAAVSLAEDTTADKAVSAAEAASKGTTAADCIVPDFTEVAGFTRINVKLKTSGAGAAPERENPARAVETETSGAGAAASAEGSNPAISAAETPARAVETEINGAGPEITLADQEAFLGKFAVLSPGDIVILAGSAPSSLGNAFYEQIISRIQQSGASFAIDIEGETLIKAIAAQPLLIKPNKQELAQIFGVQFSKLEDILPYGQKLQAGGAQNVIISMAGDGALFFTGSEVYLAPPLAGRVKNSVGAGDSMVAGFLGTFHETADHLESFKMGVAAGSATAFSDDLASPELIRELAGKVELQKLA
jgi:1-phosphofructokinase